MLAYHLPRHIRTRLSALGYARSDVVSAWTFRERLLSNFTTVTLTPPRSFTFEMPLGGYFEVLQNGWRMGLARMRAHDAGFAATLARHNVPTAWKVVTGYYSAYFAALELLRASGLAMTYLSPAHIDRLVEVSTNIGVGNLESGTFVGAVTANPLNGVVECRMVKSTYGDHETVWRRLMEVVTHFQPRNAEERTTKELLTDVLRSEGRWLPPNAVRNEWNYARPDLYAHIGETAGRAFCALAGNDNAANAWPRTRRLQPDDQNVAASVAVWRALLVPTVDLVDPVFRA